MCEHHYSCNENNASHVHTHMRPCRNFGPNGWVTTQISVFERSFRRERWDRKGLHARTRIFAVEKRGKFKKKMFVPPQ